MNWIPALTSSGVLGLIGVAIGSIYKRSVEAAIQHGLDTRLEAVKADLRGKEADISALRGGALTGLAARQSDLSRRRIDALEALWSALIDLSGKYKPFSGIARILPDSSMKASALQTSDGQKIRDFASMLLEVNKIGEVVVDYTPDRLRPHLPPLVWATFSAYRQALVNPIINLIAIRAGIGDKVISTPPKMLEAVKAALPERAGYIDQHGELSLIYIMDELEERVLSLIRDALISSEPEDKNAVEQAAHVVAIVEDLEREQRPLENALSNQPPASTPPPPKRPLRPR